ncbi:MAG: response regulator [Anaerolineae bacterium]
MTYKILAIDDHPETLDIIMTTLDASGYHVIGSRSPIRGLALAEREKPDIILLDMNMPEMDGKEVARKLRAHPDLADTPIIMFTAEGEVAQKQESFDIGVDDYLTKPTDPGEMIERIEALMANRTPKSRSPTGQVSATDVMEGLGGAGDGKSSHQSPNRQLIAVVGARGGAGTTTVAINLAMSMARQNYATTLVDFDVKQGHIALYLNQKLTPADGFNGLLNTTEMDWPMLIPAQISRYNDNLQLLLAGVNIDGSKGAITAAQANALADALTLMDRCVFVDVGCGMSAAGKVLMKRADQVLVCFRPERVSLLAARLFLRQLQALLPKRAALHAVLFDVSENIMLPQKAVEGFLGFPVMAAMAFTAKEIGQSTNKGDAYINQFPKSKTTRLFYQIAEQLAQA